MSYNFNMLLLNQMWNVSYFIFKSLNKSVLLDIFSGAWGYAPRYRELADEIKADVPEAIVVGRVGRTCEFKPYQ